MKGFFQQFLEILNPPAPPRPPHDLAAADIEHVSIPLNALTETVEEPPFDPNEFVRLYGEYMKEHYGRSAEFTTDLFCCMLPIAVEITAGTVQTLHRYWWLPLHHPVTNLLMSHNVPNCGEVDAGICGSCMIYPDSYVIEWIERILSYFKDANIELKRPSSENNNNNEEGKI